MTLPTWNSIKTNSIPIDLYTGSKINGYNEPIYYFINNNSPSITLNGYTYTDITEDEQSYVNNFVWGTKTGVQYNASNLYDGVFIYIGVSPGMFGQNSATSAPKFSIGKASPNFAPTFASNVFTSIPSASFFSDVNSFCLDSDNILTGFTIFTVSGQSNLFVYKLEEGNFSEYNGCPYDISSGYGNYGNFTGLFLTDGNPNAHWLHEIDYSLDHPLISIFSITTFDPTGTFVGDKYNIVFDDINIENGTQWSFLGKNAFYIYYYVKGADNSDNVIQLYYNAQVYTVYPVNFKGDVTTIFDYFVTPASNLVVTGSNDEIDFYFLTDNPPVSLPTYKSIMPVKLECSNYCIPLLRK